MNDLRFIPVVLVGNSNSETPNMTFKSFYNYGVIQYNPDESLQYPPPGPDTIGPHTFYGIQMNDWSTGRGAPGSWGGSMDTRWDSNYTL